MTANAYARRGCAAWLVVAALGPLALPGASAEVLTIAWNGSGRYERTMQVAPGKFAEVCGKLPAGAAVRWAFEATGVLDFNVHHHVGKDVVYATQRSSVSQGADTLAAKEPQDYCWMWSNKSASAVSLTLRMQR